MKPIIPFALLGALLAVGAADAAVTDPVGYVSGSIAGNVAANPSGAATYISPSLVQPVVYAGASTVTPSGGSVITFSGGVPTTLDESYVLEIDSGTQEGWWSAIDLSTATTITTVNAFPSGLPANVAVTVRKFNTVKSFLGSNAPGLNPFDGGTTTADEVQLLDPATGGVTSVVYLPFALSGSPDQWFDFVGGVNADDYVIEPGVAVRVIRYGPTAATFTMSGEVKTTKTQIDIFDSENWVGQPLAVGGSLGFMNFENQLIQFDGGTTLNDLLNVLDPGQGTTTYVAMDESIGGPFMLDFVGGVNANTTVIPETSGYVIIRDSSQAPSTITIPAQVVAP
jgi:hypothetical protein